MAIIGTGIAYMREEGLYKFWLLKMGFHGEQRLLMLFLLIVISINQNYNLWEKHFPTCKLKHTNLFYYDFLVLGQLVQFAR